MIFSYLFHNSIAMKHHETILNPLQSHFVGKSPGFVDSKNGLVKRVAGLRRESSARVRWKA